MRTHSIYIMIPLFLSILMLTSCSTTIKKKMDHGVSQDIPKDKDTVFWKTIDMREVYGIKYDSLLLLSASFEEDIEKSLGIEYHGGNLVDDENFYLFMLKDSKVVYKEVIPNDGSNGVEFQDLPETRGYNNIKLKDKSFLYKVKVTIENGDIYYSLSPKEFGGMDSLYKDTLYNESPAVPTIIVDEP